MRGLSLVAASRGHSSSRCAGLSLSRPLPLQSTGSRRAGSVIVAHGPSCSAACGIFPDQGSNPCPLHWQANSQPLRHQGSPPVLVLKPHLPPLQVTGGRGHLSLPLTWWAHGVGLTTRMPCGMLILVKSQKDESSKKRKRVKARV